MRQDTVERAWRVNVSVSSRQVSEEERRGRLESLREILSRIAERLATERAAADRRAA